MNKFTEYHANIVRSRRVNSYSRTACKGNQAWSKYKHSLIFRVQCYVALATKPMHRLQIRPIMHNDRAPPTIPPSYIRVRGGGNAARDTQTDTDRQTAVDNIHVSATPHVKCNQQRLDCISKLTKQTKYFQPHSPSCSLQPTNCGHHAVII